MGVLDPGRNLTTEYLLHPKSGGVLISRACGTNDSATLRCSSRKPNSSARKDPEKNRNGSFCAEPVGIMRSFGLSGQVQVSLLTGINISRLNRQHFVFPGSRAN
jgi:hypothetical protein